MDKEVKYVGDLLDATADEEWCWLTFYPMNVTLVMPLGAMEQLVDEFNLVKQALCTKEEVKAE